MQLMKSECAMIDIKETIILRPSVFLLCLLSSLLAATAEERTFVTGSRLILGTEENRSAGVRICDVDGDKDLDVVVANGRHWPQQNFVFFNQDRHTVQSRPSTG